MNADLLNASMRLPVGASWVNFHSGLVSHEDAVALHEQAMAGPSPVLMVDGKALCVCGIALLSKCVGEAWSVIDHELARQHPLLLTRSVNKAIAITAKSEGLHRLQMTVHSEDKNAVRWAFALGFTVESLMRKYGDDQSDHFLFVRFPHGQDC
jgi:hypothetical protein